MTERPRIGQAVDFYRCRVVEIVEDKPEPLDWRDDLLYREPPAPTVKSAFRQVVQIVSLDGGDSHNLKAYPDEDTAARKKALVEEDLAEMTRSEFARKYKLPW